MPKMSIDRIKRGCDKELQNIFLSFVGSKYAAAKFVCMAISGWQQLSKAEFDACVETSQISAEVAHGSFLPSI